MVTSTYVAFSGGADSTAMALRMAELGETFTILFTPTGRELPELKDHVARVVAMTGMQMVCPPGPSLDSLIDAYSALPSWRMRWCTRQVKIEPVAAFLKRSGIASNNVLCVGLRADEEAREGGHYGGLATFRRPLQEWGWKRPDVLDYCRTRGVRVPARTDCDCCPFQRLSEWYRLLRDHPERYAACEADEARTGHTYRSPGRDKWPASLVELRPMLVEVRSGARKMRGLKILESQSDDDQEKCRTCSM